MKSLQKKCMTPSQIRREERKEQITSMFAELMNKGYNKTAARYYLMNEYGVSYSYIIKITK